jgi:hypothetical protein
MNINRNELVQEIILRENLQKIIKKMSARWIREKYSDNSVASLQEQKLRKIIKKLVPNMLAEEVSETKEDVAISLVRDTLLAVVKIIKADQGKFKDAGVQDGFIKYCMLALQNDFEENHGEEAEEEIELEEPEDVQLSEPTEEEPAESEEEFGLEEPLLQEFANDGDDNLDIKIKPSDHDMFIPDEEEEEESIEDVEVDEKQAREGELFLTLTDSEKVGFRYAKETTWPKVTKQIKRIHKMAIPDSEVAKTYEQWLTKNIELHGENTKEETALKESESEAEEVAETGEEESAF